MTSKSTISGVLLTAALLSASVAPASAADDPDTGWHKYRSEDVSYVAGERCAFPVTGVVTRDGEQYRDVSLWPDGQVRTELFKGPLFIRWTNTDTGASVLLDQSGRAELSYDSAGNLESLMALTGHFTSGMPAGSKPFAGIAYVGGRYSSVVFGDDGTRTITLGPRGTIQNVCDLIG